MSWHGRSCKAVAAMHVSISLVMGKSPCLFWFIVKRCTSLVSKCFSSLCQGLQVYFFSCKWCFGSRFCRSFLDVLLLKISSLESGQQARHLQLSLTCILHTASSQWLMLFNWIFNQSHRTILVSSNSSCHFICISCLCDITSACLA